MMFMKKKNKKMSMKMISLTKTFLIILLIDKTIVYYSLTILLTTSPLLPNAAIITVI